MGIALGGLGGIVAYAKNSELVALLEPRSFLFAAISVLIFTFLAYFSNPNEASFRAFLTERSFRKHLSRLDDTREEDEEEESTTRPPPSYSHLPRSDPTTALTGTAPLHFARCASVAMRTPSHMFRSFFVVSIASVASASTAFPAERQQHKTHISRPRLTDTWFIGAFGIWWQIGSFAFLAYGSTKSSSSSKSTEGPVPGVLDVKSLDPTSDGTDGLQFTGSSVSIAPTSKHLYSSRKPPTASSLPSPPSSTGRSSTPPPLPESASLPLHAKRGNPLASPDSNRRDSSVPTTQPADDTGAGEGTGPSDINDGRTSPVPEGPPPAVADLLQQIAIAQSVVVDVRNQLADVQSSAAASHLSLQSDLETQRARKRADDAARSELKSRTKAVEDQRRHADLSKREAEKKLKAAQTQRDSARDRMAKLTKEIDQLRHRMLDDRSRADKSRTDRETSEIELTDSIERKRIEIKVAEDVVQALNARSRDLEELITVNRDRLQRAQDAAGVRKQDREFRRFEPDHDEGPWPDSFTVQIPSAQRRESARPPQLSTGSLSSLQTNGFSISDRQTDTDNGAFMPFGDASSYTRPSLSPWNQADLDLLSPSAGSNLIPRSLIKSLDGEGISPAVERLSLDTGTIYNHRNTSWPPSHQNQTLLASPVELSPDDDPFEVKPHRQRLANERWDSQRALLASRNFTEQLETEESRPLNDLHRWPSNSTSTPQSQVSTSPGITTSKRGLNPAAKEFSFRGRFANSLGSSSSRNESKKSVDIPVTSPPSDVSSTRSSSTMTGTPALPSPRAPAVKSVGSIFSSLRAFAPSPAELEVLQRHLGGSSSGSSSVASSNGLSSGLERVSSHSSGSGGTAPNSPSLLPPAPVGSSRKSFGLTKDRFKDPSPPVWPPPSKTFSPWDDDYKPS